MNEEIKLILEANQLILRDRLWNNKHFEVQSKITDANISKLLNPNQKENKNVDVNKETDDHFANYTDKEEVKG